MLYELRGVKLMYADCFSLDIPDLRIEKGECVALTGPNGSGKTSLLKLLDGLTVPTEGTVLRDGKPVTKNARPTPQSVYLHQQPYLMCGSVAYNVSFGCRSLGLGARETKMRVDEAIGLLGLERVGNRAHSQLSGGEAQRVALARALAVKPEILLLDEPTASADAESLTVISRALRLCVMEGATLIFSTHDEAFINGLSPRRIRLEEGKIIEDTGGSA